MAESNVEMVTISEVTNVRAETGQPKIEESETSDVPAPVPAPIPEASVESDQLCKSAQKSYDSVKQADIEDQILPHPDDVAGPSGLQQQQRPPSLPEMDELNADDNVALAPRDDDDDTQRRTDSETCCELCLGRIVTATQRYQDCMNCFLNSPFMLVIYITFLILPSYACIIGVMNLEKCPVSSVIPLFVLFIGIAALIVVLFRLWASISDFYCESRQLWTAPPAIYLVLYHMIVLFLVWEIAEYYSVNPIFDDATSPNFCDPDFFFQVYIFNICVGSLLAVAPLIYGFQTLALLKAALSARIQSD